MTEVCIHFNFGEAEISEITIDPGVPSTRCLLETIQCSLESTHMILLIKSLETFWFPVLEKVTMFNLQ